MLDPVPHISLIGLTTVFGFEGHAGPDAPQGTPYRQWSSPAAKPLVVSATPAMLLDTTHLHREVGVGTHEHAFREHPMLPTTVDERALEQQDGHGAGVGDPEMRNGRTILELT